MKGESKMEKKGNETVQVMISLEGGLVKDVQAFRSEQSAQEMWDKSIEEAKKSVKYENLSPLDQGAFDQDPFGFAYGGDMELIWEERTLKD